MEQVQNGSQRRKTIVTLLKQSVTPLSGATLGKETGVSRQVVVQDIALLRTEGVEIVATPRGYVLNTPKQVMRVFKTYHTNEQTEEELTAIVDLGGCFGCISACSRGIISTTLILPGWNIRLS